MVVFPESFEREHPSGRDARAPTKNTAGRSLDIATTETVNHGFPNCIRSSVVAEDGLDQVSDVIRQGLVRLLVFGFDLLGRSVYRRRVRNQPLKPKCLARLLREHSFRLLAQRHDYLELIQIGNPVYRFGRLVRDVDALIGQETDRLRFHHARRDARAVEGEPSGSHARGYCFGNSAQATVGLVDEQYAKALARHVTQILAGGKVKCLLADVGGLVGDALETARHGDQWRQRFQRQPALLAPIHQIGGQLVANLIDPRLTGHCGACQVGIFVYEGVHGVVQHGDRQVRNVVEFFGGDFVVLRADQQNLAGDAFSIVAARAPAG